MQAEVEELQLQVLQLKEDVRKLNLTVEQYEVRCA